MEQKMHGITTATPLIRLWHNYQHFVKNATQASIVYKSPSITNWSDRLFTRFITYLFPVCSIALLPGVCMGIIVGDIFIVVFDLATILLIGVVVLNSKLNLTFRKLFVIFMLYSLTMALIVNLGLLGPGLVYLLMMNILVTLFFSRYLAYLSIITNIFICGACAFIISLKLFNSPLILEYTIGTWIAISSNLIFLSWVSVLLIAQTISNLEGAINKEFILKNELKLVNAKILKKNQLIHESEIHYKSLFFNSPSPMWVLNNESLKFLQVNESAIHDYGYTCSEFMTMTLADIKLEKDMGNIYETLQKPSLSGSPASTITEHRRKNNERFYVEVRYNTFLFNGQEATLSIIRDMTEQINFTKAIEDQNIKFKEIAWILSHVVRAPLARMMGLIDLITRNKNKNPDLDVLTYLDQTAKEFDEIIKTISDKTGQL